ncbi:MAG: ribonuclease HII [Lentisphaerae bacterium]|nr:MAG: ribonuclease HII [Lentisphaerota bacterium]
MFHFPPKPADPYEYLNIVWTAGFQFVAGVDEAGRGPLAGPVVAAAVSIPPGYEFKFPVDDSKSLSETKRENIYEAIVNDPDCSFAITELNHEAIDRLNIFHATMTAMTRVITSLKPLPQVALIDGNRAPTIPGQSITLIPIVKGDAKCAIISAASILAKVHRDRIMRQYHQQYPQYGFDRHKGYGTAEHLDAIRKYGPCPIHRRSFEPIRSLSDKPRSKEKDLFSDL